MTAKNKILIISLLVIFSVLLLPIIYHNIKKVSLPSHISFRKIIFKDDVLDFQILKFTTNQDSTGLCFKETTGKASYDKPILMFDSKKGDIKFNIERKDNTISFHYTDGIDMHIYLHSFKKSKLNFVGLSFNEFYEKGYLEK